ncbi:MAG: hypothetical protein O8C66_09875 [Candidatus Methanoperedens sp.]|jgi:hypothetical protein|nr:hypothetical protein [Candidatus Methanoperedens sp.]MCZ7370804.1 hypothetical protein [Candidatus Methanoperedens sp.]
MMDLEELRKKVRETTEKELVRDAFRARKFSGLATLRQGMDLIDFALRVKKAQHEEN